MKQKMFSKILSAVLLLGLLIPGSAAPQAQADLATEITADYAHGEVLVKFRPAVMPAAVPGGVETGVASLDALVQQYKVTAAESVFPELAHSTQGLERIFKLTLPATADVLAAAGAFAADTHVEYAEPNYIYHISESALASTAEAALPAALQCDTDVYYGIQHCTDDNDQTHVIRVDLNDPHIRVQTVLSSGLNGECSSVNPNAPGRDNHDPTSNCPYPYPFETVESMLHRYVTQGAVAIINTDYFGLDGDHGAQGLAVRNGERLDGLAHNDDDGGGFLGSTQPSLAFSPSNTATIGIPSSEQVINDNLSGTYTNTVGGAPIIVQGGTVVNSDCTFPYPGDTCSQLGQSAAGLTADGRLVLITARKNAEDIANYLVGNYQVHTALKFDGGGSAGLAWLDSAGQVLSFGATGEPRPVAEGLLIFSTRIPSAPSDPLFKYQWALHNPGQTGGTEDADIDALEAWGVITGTTDVMIAVIDTGVDYTHEELDDGRVRTDIDKDYVNGDADAMDDHGHGTHVAGTIGAETGNGVGVAGVMWQVQILPLKVLNSQGSGTAEHVADAIRYAADQGADAINMSLGSSSCSKTMAEAVNYAYFDKGVIVVAAAGNSGGSMGYPARFDPVIAVGAVDHNDNRAQFSSHGPNLDIVAPGVTILSTVPNFGYDAISGTSMASPHVAGVAGLLLAQRPELSTGQVSEILRQSADDLGKSGFDIYYGYGRVNAYEALQTVTPDEPDAPKRAACPETCGASAAVAGESDGQSLLGNLRAVRDEVFTDDPGRRWASIYYEHQPEVAWLIVSNSELRADALAGFRAFDPVFRGLLGLDDAGSPVLLTPNLVEAAERALMGVAESGSSAVRNDIVREWEKVDPDRFIGWEVRDVWNQLRQEEIRNRVYLPVVLRSSPN
jgi:subtilisin family serine protease